MIRLAGVRDLDALLVHRGANLRHRVSRLLRRVQERGCTSPTHVGASELPDALDQFFNCYARQWGRNGHPHALQSPETRPYWTALAHAAAGMNKLHFSSLRVSGRDWHWHLGFHHKRSLLWYKMAYEQEFADKSPGMLHLALLVKEGLEQRMDVIDLGYGSEDYKYKWTDEQCELHSIYLPGSAFVNVARNLTGLAQYYARTLKRGVKQRVEARPQA
jgi:CelD/BcsL family acetyltransferase involved in cellulose biosynthesis